MNDARHGSGGPWPAPGEAAGQRRNPDQPDGAGSTSGAPCGAASEVVASPHPEAAREAPTLGPAGGASGGASSAGSGAATSPKRRWSKLEPNFYPKPAERREQTVWNRRVDLLKAEERVAAARRALDKATGALTDYRLSKLKDVLGP